MRISVFGMGYVGCVTAACLVKQGHNVIGVDIIKSKIKGLNNDIWPVYEPGLNELNKKQILKEKFFATSDEKKALKETEVGIICVGTPNLSDGSVDIKYVESVIEKVSDYFNKSSKDYTLLVRSTIPPGSTHQLVYNRFKKVNNIQIAFFPEFLREGSAINDFFFPSLKVIGCKKNFPIKIMDKIFPDVEGEWNITNYEIAESLKYISNSWHALKIVFTNEIASVLKEYNLNSEQSMELFCQDKLILLCRQVVSHFRSSTGPTFCPYSTYISYIPRVTPVLPCRAKTFFNIFSMVCIVYIHFLMTMVISGSNVYFVVSTIFRKSIF